VILVVRRDFRLSPWFWTIHHAAVKISVLCVCIWTVADIGLCKKAVLWQRNCAALVLFPNHNHFHVAAQWSRSQSCQLKLFSHRGLLTVLTCSLATNHAVSLFKISCYHLWWNKDVCIARSPYDSLARLSWRSWRILTLMLAKNNKSTNHFQILRISTLHLGHWMKSG